MCPRKKVTLRDVSAAAGVSVSSVSMILNDRSDVSFTEETVERVRRAARELGYKAPDRHRKPLLALKKCVLIASPNVTNGYYSSLVQAVEQMAAAHNFSAIAFNTFRDPAQEEELLSMAEALGVAGIVFTMIPQSISLVERVNRAIPTVVIGDRRDTLKVDTVEMDNYQSGILVGRHLLGLGHRHVAFVSTTLNQANDMRVRRLKGLQSVYAAAGPGCSVTVLSQNITPNEERNEIGIEHRVGLELTNRLLRRKSPVTALVAVNDSVAFGVLDALAEAGLRVPDDYSVCGFDNLPISRIRSVGLTTIDHQVEEKGRRAFNILHDRIAGDRTANNITRVEFTHSLLQGRTSGPAPQRAAPKDGDGAEEAPGAKP